MSCSLPLLVRRGWTLYLALLPYHRGRELLCKDNRYAHVVGRCGACFVGTTGGACERGGGRVMVGIQVGASNRGIESGRAATKTMQVPLVRRARWRQHQSLRAFTCSWLRRLGLFSEG